MFLLNEALYQYGIRSDVVRIAAGMIKVKKGTPLTFVHILSWPSWTSCYSCCSHQHYRQAYTQYHRQYHRQDHRLYTKHTYRTTATCRSCITMQASQQHARGDPHAIASKAWHCNQSMQLQPNHREAWVHLKLLYIECPTA